MNTSKFHDLDGPPCMMKLRIIPFSYKKVFLMVIVNIKVYTRSVHNPHGFPSRSVPISP